MLLIGYTYKSLNVVQRNNSFFQIHTTQKHNVAERRIVECFIGGVYSDYRTVRVLISVICTSQLRLHRDIIAIYSQIHTKQTNTVWGERSIVECLTVVTYSDQ